MKFIILIYTVYNILARNFHRPMLMITYNGDLYCVGETWLFHENLI